MLGTSEQNALSHISCKTPQSNTNIPVEPTTWHNHLIDQSNAWSFVVSHFVSLLLSDFNPAQLPIICLLVWSENGINSLSDFLELFLRWLILIDPHLPWYGS